MRKVSCYLTPSAASISFCPSGTSLANSAYELSRATLTHWSYSAGVSVTTSTLWSLNTLTISSSRALASFAKYACDFLPEAISTSCCFLSSRSKLFFDISTGSYKKQRSEEHTSELQSLRHLVCRLLLEKK